MTTKPVDAVPFLWQHVDRNGPVPSHRPELGPCWVWTGRRLRRGYGMIAQGAGKYVLTHRLSYALAYGPIPDGLLVCHHCDNPSCVNPPHLFAGTHADNMADMAAKGRRRDGPRIRRDGYVRGESHPAAKLTEPQVREIRALVDAGSSRHELAARFGVSRQMVRKIANRQAWTHL